MADELVYVDEEIVGEIVPVERAEQVQVEHRDDRYTVERLSPAWTKIRAPKYASTNIPVPRWSDRVEVPPGVSLTFYDRRRRPISEYSNRSGEAQVFEFRSNAMRFSVEDEDPRRRFVDLLFEIAI